MRVGRITRNGRHYKHIHKCIVCDKLFSSKRKDAKTCSTNCRSVIYRRKRKHAEKKHRQLCKKHGLPVPKTRYHYAKLKYNL